MKNTFMEEWRDVIGYEGLYQVSNYGLVKSLYDGRHKKFRELIMRPGMDTKGYLFVTLYKDDKPKPLRINRLVAMAFIPIPEHLKHIPIEELDVEHIDANRGNNRLDNLRWNTHKGNMENPLTRQRISEAKKGKHHTEETKRKMSESRINGKKSKCVLQLDKETDEVIKEWPSLGEVQRQLGYSQANICNCCKGKRNTASGYKWQYA